MSPIPRRRALQAIAGGAVGTLAGCIGDLTGSDPPAVGTADDAAWPQGRADARNTGTSETATVPTDPPTSDWTFEIETSLETGLGRGVYDVVVGDGTLFTAMIRRPVRTEVEDGTDTYSTPVTTTPSEERTWTLEVYAVDVPTGDQRWLRAVDFDAFAGKGRRAIALSDGGLHLGVTVDATDDSDDLGPTVLTLDREDGSVRHRGGPLYTALTVGEGRLYGVGVDPDTGEPTYLGTDPSTGEVEWRATSSEGTIPGGGLALDGEHLFATESPPDGSGGRRVVAWSLDDGSRVWETDPFPESDTLAPPAVGSGVVVALSRKGGEETAGATVVGFDVGDGSRRFEYETGGIPSPPVLLDGTALVLGAPPDRTSRLHAIDLDDGTAEFELDLGVETYGSPVSDGDRVLLPGVHPMVVDPEDGTTVWRASSETETGGTTGTNTDDADTHMRESVVVPGREYLFGIPVALGNGPGAISGYRAG